jgi:translocation and assembly module TamB
VTGSVADPIVDGTFAVENGRADDVPFQSLNATVRMASRTARIDASLNAGERGTAKITGTVPIDPTATSVDVAITAQLSDVGVIAPALPYVTEASGAATADLTIKGSLEAPDINGMVQVNNVRFRVPETGVAYRNMNGALQVRNSVLEVQSFSVEDQDGKPLTMTGRLDVLNQQKAAEVDVRIRANDFTLLANQFGQVGVNIDLTAVGTMVAPQIIGQITIVRGRFEVDRLLQEFAASSGYVDQAVVTGRAEPASPEPPNVYSGAAMSIDVRLPDNVVVRGRGLQTEEGSIGLGDINLTLGGTLQIRKARGEQPSLVGDVNAVRGTYEFQGRRFQIQRGSRLRFRGDDYTNPALDITATREVSGVDVTVRIGGTAAEPSLTLSSDPTLDQGDILALIVFNRPINELGEGQKVSLASRAGTIAATALAGPIADSVAQALNLDVFEIRPEDVGSNGPVVEVGRQVSDRLYVGFRHDFGAGGRNQVTLEYRLNEFLRLLTTLSQGADPATLRGQADSAGIDLIYVIRR